MSTWIKTAEQLPPDEWFFTTGNQGLHVVVLAPERDPVLETWAQASASKQTFQQIVPYWQFAEEMPADMLQLRGENHARRVEEIKTSKYGPALLKREEEKLAQERAAFDAWVKAGKPTPSPRLET